MSFESIHAGKGAQVQPKPYGDPLSYAVRARDSNVIAMVEKAVREDNVMLAYQPVVPALRHDRPAFYEGLMRVLDDSGRVIPARDFIEQVENTELGRQIDTLAVKYGLQMLREQPGLRLSINMSAKSIGHTPWMDMLERGLAMDPTVGERLILEITESSAITVPQMVGEFMNDLQVRGISFAIDDFGSGYTSMRYLKELYFDILKIDGQFIRGIADSPDNRALVAAMVSIGQHFDMVTIAEKVETAADAAVLGQMGVDCLQGYFFGAPSIRPRWEACDLAHRAS